MNVPAAALTALVALAPAMTTPLPTDVQRDAWYGDVVAEFVAKGYIPGGGTFRPADRATRAEFVTLLMASMGKQTDITGDSHFTDLPLTHPAYSAIETATAMGILRGEDNCFGLTPCFVRPDGPVNRAEAATMLMRAHQPGEAAAAPSFPDNAPGAWYAETVRQAAGHCILLGDDASGTVRPADFMNRAEMAVMIKRSTEGRTYPDCSDVGDAPASAASSVSTTHSASALLHDAALINPLPLWTEDDGDASRTVTVDATVSRVVFGFAHEDRKAVLSLRMPDGTSVTASNAEKKGISYVGEGGVFDAFDVPNPMRGEWTMEAKGTGKLQLNALISGSVQLQLPTVYAPSGTKLGVPMAMSANFDGVERVKRAEVLLRVGTTSGAADVDAVMMTEQPGYATDLESWPTTYGLDYVPVGKGTLCFAAIAKGETVAGEEFLREAGGWCTVVQ